MNETINLNNIIYPEFYKTKYIFTYSSFNKELKEIIEQSGFKNEFTRKYRKALRFLDGLKRNCTNQKSFERLSSETEIYSIRLIGEKNIRILFTFMKFSNEEIAVLVYSFQEKDDKNNSKTSYSANIKIAEKRIEELVAKTHK